MSDPRCFRLMRHTDVTGVSGEGHVADGVEFPDGVVVLRWLGDYASTVVWDDLAKAMHVHGHDGQTRVHWLDGHNDPGLIVVRPEDSHVLPRVEDSEVDYWIAHGHINAMSFGEDYLTADEARHWAACYATAADLLEAQRTAQQGDTHGG